MIVDYPIRGEIRTAYDSSMSQFLPKDCKGSSLLIAL